MLCNIVSLQPYRLYFTARMLLGWLLLPGWKDILPSTLMALSDPGVSGNHAKSVQIPMSFQYDQGHDHDQGGPGPGPARP